MRGNRVQRPAGDKKCHLPPDRCGLAVGAHHLPRLCCRDCRCRLLPARDGAEPVVVHRHHYDRLQSAPTPACQGTLHVRQPAGRVSRYQLTGRKITKFRGAAAWSFVGASPDGGGGGDPRRLVGPQACARGWRSIPSKESVRRQPGWRRRRDRSKLPGIQGVMVKSVAGGAYEPPPVR
jgi:hypothetical protein